MNDREHGRALLDLAEHDLRALQGMMMSVPGGEVFFTDAIFGFHAQQAAEKALKAWMAYCGLEFPLTHDLKILIDRLAAAGQDVTDFDGLIDLNPFAVQYRYETLLATEDEINRPEMLRMVKDCFVRIDAAIAAD